MARELSEPSLESTATRAAAGLSLPALASLGNLNQFPLASHLTNKEPNESLQKHWPARSVETNQAKVESRIAGTIRFMHIASSDPCPVAHCELLSPCNSSMASGNGRF